MVASWARADHGFGRTGGAKSPTPRGGGREGSRPAPRLKSASARVRATQASSLEKKTLEISLQMTCAHEYIMQLHTLFLQPCRFGDDVRSRCRHSSHELYGIETLTVRTAIYFYVYIIGWLTSVVSLSWRHMTAARWLRTSGETSLCEGKMGGGEGRKKGVAEIRKARR